MNRVVYFLICAFAICSCAKDTESGNAPIEGDPMQFSLGTLTRIAEKSTWAADDTIAIYREDDTEPKCYTVTNANGDLTPPADGGWDYSYDYSNYRAIYPYKASTTYDNYIASLPTFTTYNATDILIADYATAEDQYLELQFSHAYAKITITDTEATTYTVTLTAGGEDPQTKNSANGKVEYWILAGDYTDNLTITASILGGTYDMTITPSKYIFEGGVDYEVEITIE